MSFIRIIFFGTLVILLLPSDRSQQARLNDHAHNVLNWTMTFCDRNAATCAKGSEIWAVFVKKAEFAAQVAGDLIRQSLTDRDQRPLPAHFDNGQPSYRLDRPNVEAPYQRAPDDAASGTLRPDDLLPAWRGARTQGPRA